MAKKIIRGIRFTPEHVMFILEHTGRIGTNFQDFVIHSVNKEIKFLQDNKKAMEQRAIKKLKS